MVVKAGNVLYRRATDLPSTIPVFPLSAALLLPRGRMPLNIFEPRYLAMIDDQIGGDRLVGMIQPALDGSLRDDGEPQLCQVGCIGRLTSLTETGDGRYLVSLEGICRFRVVDEPAGRTPYRQCSIVPFLADLEEDMSGRDVNRTALLQAFKAYLKANDLDADWDSVSRADNDTLVNALSMMSPYGPAEKQALLEASDLKTRAETLIAITEIELARGGDESGPALQ